MRAIYLISGLLALALGVAGAFLPLLPTTPFVLLAAFCFSRSSERMHDWLMNRSPFGPLIRQWQEQRSIPPKARRRALLVMAASFGITIVFFAKPLYLQIALLILALTGMTIIARLPVAEPVTAETEEPQ